MLYNHAPMLAAIGIGEVKVVDTHNSEFRYATSGGFVDVVRNHVVLLAETVERPEEIDVSRAEASRDRAAKRIHERKPETDIDRARVALARALNRKRLAQRT